MSLRSVTLIVCLLLLSAICLLAQTSGTSPVYVDFRVMISYQDGTRFGDESKTGMAGVNAGDRSGSSGSHPTGTASNMQIRVQVLDENGSTVSEKFPNNEGTAQFRVVGYLSTPRGRLYPSYRVRVFGSEIEEAWAENVEPGRADRVLNVAVRHKGEKQMANSADGSVSATSLKIPGKAQKELEKGNEALSENKYDAAKQHFHKAIDIYPQYELAYNNLGVVLMKQGDTAGGTQAFEKALSINDKFARAYVNLGKIDIGNKKYEEALTSFSKSLAIEPLNIEALSGVCQAGIMAKQYQQVIDAAKRIHGVPQHESSPICHFAAGLAYRNLNKSQEAIDEYIIYLKEAPTSAPLVAKARESIAELNKQTAAQ